MKALVKYAAGNGHVDIREVDEPICRDDQVKIEVAFCGVCGTDLHVMHDTFRNYPPVILGHELSGTVVETGRDVRDVPLGQRVAVLGATSVTCGECEHCRSGYFIFCPNRRGMGHGVNGGFARYVAARPDQLYPVPDGMTLEEAALSEPFAAIVQAVLEIARVRPGETAVVSGPGPMGLLCLKLLVAEGVTTIVAGTAADRERLDAATPIRRGRGGRRRAGRSGRDGAGRDRRPGRGCGLRMCGPSGVGARLPRIVAADGPPHPGGHLRPGHSVSTRPRLLQAADRRRDRVLHGADVGSHVRDLRASAGSFWATSCRTCCRSRNGGRRSIWCRTAARSRC